MEPALTLAEVDDCLAQQRPGMGDTARGFKRTFRFGRPRDAHTQRAAVAECLDQPVINRITRMGLLSKLAERVTFVLIPPLLLIFLVLGTIFLGVATPTEGGAMGAMGALIMATLRKRLSWSLLRQ